MTVKFSGATYGITRLKDGTYVLYSNGNFHRAQFSKFYFGIFSPRQPKTTLEKVNKYGDGNLSLLESLE